MKPCNSSSHKQTRFRGNQIHLPSRHLDVLTVYSSCKLKTRQEERQGMKLPLETIAFYSDSFVARKINVEQKVAENWAPYCTYESHRYYLNNLYERSRLQIQCSKITLTLGLFLIDIGQKYSPLPPTYLSYKI